MITIKYLRENTELVVNRLKIKNFDAQAIADKIIQIDDLRKETQSKLDNCLAESNIISKQIGLLFKEGKVEEANKAKEKTGNLKAESKELSEKLNKLETDQNELIIQLPNIPNQSVSIPRINTPGYCREK